MNLLDVLEGRDWSIQQAIQTTFPFDPQFYSSYVRPRLRKRNCDLPLVLIDGSRYEKDITSSDWSAAPIGTDYLLEPVATPGVFHPKINLFASDRSVYYTISSANLSLEEYCKAAQIGYADGFQKDTLTDEPTQVAESYYISKDVRDLFTDLIDQDGLVTGQDARNYITETAETLSWLDDAVDTGAFDQIERTTRFLSNISDPILSQALTQLDERDWVGNISRAQLYAPFYGTPDVLQRLATKLNADQLDLLVDEESTALEVGRLSEAMDGIDYTVRKMESKRTTRWVHAKFLMLEGDWGRACLYGSPNMTSTALMNDSAGGNIEAALFTIVRAGSSNTLKKAVFDADSYQFTVSDPIESPETLDLRSSSYEGWESLHQTEQTNIRLEDARITQPGSDDKSELILTIAGITGEHQFTVRTNDDAEKTVEADIGSDDPELSITLSPSDRESWTQSVVTVHTEGASSNPRRIVEKTQAYYREYREMSKSAGTQSSNTLLREILQNPDTAAVNVFDIALSELQNNMGQATSADTSSSEEETEESFPEKGPTNLTRGGRSLPSLHTLISQHLEYHREKALTALDVDKQPLLSDLQEFVDHARTFWETIELCFTLDMLGQLDTDQVSTDKLFSKCEQQLEGWFESLGVVTQRVKSIIEQIENSASMQDSAVEDADTTISEHKICQSVCDLLFLHPGIVLEFESNTSHSVLQSKNKLRNQIVNSFKECHPYVAKHLLQGDILVEQVENLLDTLSVEFGTSEEEIKLSGRGIQVVVLYILIQRTDASKSFLSGLSAHEQFSGDSLTNLINFALEAEEAIFDYGIMNQLEKAVVHKDGWNKIQDLR